MYFCIVMQIGGLPHEILKQVLVEAAVKRKLFGERYDQVYLGLAPVCTAWCDVIKNHLIFPLFSVRLLRGVSFLESSKIQTRL